jgi:hypothetical protein
MRYEGRWCDSPKTEVSLKQMAAPYDNIFVGSDPCDGFSRADAESFQAFLNVSDSECNYFDPLPGQRMHWHPINEMGYWGYAPLFYCKKVLDYHYGQKNRIYLHCHAGAHRSPMMGFCWLLSRGHTVKDAARILWNGDNPRSGHWEVGAFKRDLTIYRVLPRRLMEFYRRVKENPTYSLMGYLYNHQDGFIENTREVKGNLSDQEMKMLWENMPKFYEKDPVGVDQAMRELFRKGVEQLDIAKPLFKMFEVSEDGV